MKTLKRSILYMTKKYISARERMICVYKTQYEKEYLSAGESNDNITFYFDDIGRVVGMIRVENGIATNYEWSGK